MFRSNQSNKSQEIIIIHFLLIGAIVLHNGLLYSNTVFQKQLLKQINQGWTITAKTSGEEEMNQRESSFFLNDNLVVDDEGKSSWVFLWFLTFSWTFGIPSYIGGFGCTKWLPKWRPIYWCFPYFWWLEWISSIFGKNWLWRFSEPRLGTFSPLSWLFFGCWWLATLVSSSHSWFLVDFCQRLFWFRQKFLLWSDLLRFSQ